MKALKNKKVRIAGQFGKGMRMIITGVVERNSPKEKNVIIYTEMGNHIPYNRQRLITSLKGGSQ